jgi:hypothetical protein
LLDWLVAANDPRVLQPSNLAATDANLKDVQQAIDSSGGKVQPRPVFWAQRTGVFGATLDTDFRLFPDQTFEFRSGLLGPQTPEPLVGRVPVATLQQLLALAAGAEEGGAARNEGYGYVQWLDAQGKKQVKGFTDPQQGPSRIIFSAVNAAVCRYAAPRPSTPADPAVVAKLITQLDDESYDRRESASQQLEEMGSLIHGLLEDALARKDLSPEMTSRLQAILGFTSIFRTWDPRTRIAIRIEDSGATLAARKDGKLLWSVNLGSQAVTEVTIGVDYVFIRPMNWNIDLHTGKPTNISKR